MIYYVATPVSDVRLAINLRALGVPEQGIFMFTVKDNTTRFNNTTLNFDVAVKHGKMHPEVMGVKKLSDWQYHVVLENVVVGVVWDGKDGPKVDMSPYANRKNGKQVEGLDAMIEEKTKVLTLPKGTKIGGVFAALAKWTFTDVSTDEPRSIPKGYERITDGRPMHDDMVWTGKKWHTLDIYERGDGEFCGDVKLCEMEYFVVREIEEDFSLYGPDDDCEPKFIPETVYDPELYTPKVEIRTHSDVPWDLVPGDDLYEQGTPIDEQCVADVRVAEQQYAENVYGFGSDYAQ